mmetsp:Transcript_8181/g.7599  ORF Transcript_8181/g.7599 Transcript_8181/m.7599 type:complete len:134 (-) Transcript_8181:203-604(-)|eukprot:CAMPEP_0170556270 /NCGR_PEP_ID=MMETSP0211-20121228/16021_1 /TAXON_ID=311385 /ORGANISM="Pseudokeronopsis sp., Strain OXSARD2" /LENGTH=133 /DNA_ID=CAMNT_0010866503 /DNA_START=129 /DNA_END=530 /DNA_ORIENTATION=+
MLGGIVVSSLLILIFMGGVILTVIFTVVYPGYKSIKALETKDSDDDDKIWLTYWCVFGVFSLVDEFGGVLLSLIPFYYYIKLALFIWMMNPTTQGSNVIYKSVLRPLLLQHKDRIQKFINEVKGEAMNFAKEA